MPDPAKAADPLTKRERQVLELVSQGLDNKAIGETFGVLQSTTESHGRSTFLKMGASNRTEAVEIDRQSGLLR